jgi:uncharacterized cupin superfamily protein
VPAVHGGFVTSCDTLCEGLHVQEEFMTKIFACGLFGTVALSIAIHHPSPVFAQDAAAPVRLDPDRVAGIGLTAIPPDAFKDILESGELKMRVAKLFEGKELRVEIFESTPAKTNHKRRPTDGDEFVYVLSGKLILTEFNGKKQEFHPGQSVVLPTGYNGTWEMQGNYREIAVVAAKRK